MYVYIYIYFLYKDSTNRFLLQAIFDPWRFDPPSPSPHDEVRSPYGACQNSFVRDAQRGDDHSNVTPPPPTTTTAGGGAANYSWYLQTIWY